MNRKPASTGFSTERKEPGSPRGGPARLAEELRIPFKLIEYANDLTSVMIGSYGDQTLFPEAEDSSWGSPGGRKLAGIVPNFLPSRTFRALVSLVRTTFFPAA